jgi:hypothetical protein
MDKDRLLFYGARVVGSSVLGAGTGLLGSNEPVIPVLSSSLNVLHQITFTYLEKVHDFGLIGVGLDGLPIKDSSFFVLGGLALQFGVDFTTKGIQLNNNEIIHSGVLISLLGLTAITYGEMLMEKNKIDNS